MMKLVKYDDLGRNQFSWLDARHHFSFGQYHDPERMGFANLRVVNDDIVNAHSGFDTHPHRDMEIITYVRQGAITHRDSMGNEGRTEVGDVQVMSAGSGVYHSEHNEEDIDTNLYQIWILPNEARVKPRWDAKKFPKEEGQTELSLLVSGDETDDALFIHADAKIYGGQFANGLTVSHTGAGTSYILVSQGQIKSGDVTANKGDAIQITDQKDLRFEMLEDSEILAIDLEG